MTKRLGPPTRAGVARGGAGQRGFTLIELMVVITIIVILLSLAIPNYQKTILHAQETVLRDDLYTLRSLIDQYTLDKQKAPQSLQDIVDAGYLKQLPKDPFTNSRESWVPVADDSILSPDQTEPGIIDVHSGSDSVSSEGTAYSTW
jgi:general secretion pathway protein G